MTNPFLDQLLPGLRKPDTALQTVFFKVSLLLLFGIRPLSRYLGQG